MTDPDEADQLSLEENKSIPTPKEKPDQPKKSSAALPISSQSTLIEKNPDKHIQQALSLFTEA